MHKGPTLEKETLPREFLAPKSRKTPCKRCPLCTKSRFVVILTFPLVHKDLTLGKDAPRELLAPQKL